MQNSGATTRSRRCTPRRRCPLPPVLTLLIALVPATATAQAPVDAIPTASIYLSDWGIEDIRSIRTAQFSLAALEGRDALSVYFLSVRPPAPLPDGFRSRITGTLNGMMSVSTFEGGNRNDLGGYFNSFADRSSSADVSIARAPDGVRALRAECDRSASGYCGLWIHTFDFTLPSGERWFLDVTALQHLSFWIRSRPGLDIELKVADAAWERREDSLPVGRVAEFVREGRLTGEWQLALVPIARFPDRIQKRELASIVFQQLTEGPGQFFLSEMFFLESDDALPPGRRRQRRRSIQERLSVRRGSGTPPS